MAQGTECYEFSLDTECGAVVDYTVGTDPEGQAFVFDNFLAEQVSAIRMLPLFRCRRAIIRLVCAAAFPACVDGVVVPACQGDLCDSLQTECGPITEFLPGLENCSAFVNPPVGVPCVTPGLPIEAPIPVDTCLPEEEVACCQGVYVQGEKTQECIIPCPVWAYSEAKDKAITFILYVQMFVNSILCVLGVVPFLTDAPSRSFPNHLPLIICVVSTLLTVFSGWSLYYGGSEDFICYGVGEQEDYTVERVKDSDCITQSFFFALFTFLYVLYALALNVRMVLFTLSVGDGGKSEGFVIQNSWSHALVCHGLVLTISFSLCIALLVETVQLKDELNSVNVGKDAIAVMVTFGSFCGISNNIDSLGFYVFYIPYTIFTVCNVIASTIVLIQVFRLSLRLPSVLAFAQWRAITISLYITISSIIYLGFVYSSINSYETSSEKANRRVFCSFSQPTNPEPGCKTLEGLGTYYGLAVVNFLFVFSTGGFVAILSFLSQESVWLFYKDLFTGHPRSLFGRSAEGGGSGSRLTRNRSSMRRVHTVSSASQSSV